MQSLNATASETHLTATAIQGSVSTIQSDVSRNQGVNAALLGQIHNSIPVENEKLQRQVQSLISGNSLGLAKRFDSQQKQITDFKDISLAETAKMDRKLDFLTSFITSGMMPTVSTSSTFSVDGFTRTTIAAIARNECNSVLRDVLGQLNISQSQRETLEKQLRGVADGASTELLREDATNRNERASFIDNTNYDEKRLMAGDGSHFSQPPRRKERISTYEVHRPWLGTIRIITYCIGKRNKATKKWEQSVEVSINIWSTLPILRNRCTDILFTTESSSSGHSQLFPLIATYPIVPNDSPVFQYVTKGDIESLRSAFVEGRASPNDQGENGWTLLHVKMCSSTYYCEIG
ncbi:hypothetical protein BS50DRAFT_341584 [Corynespora cassiicola Philippines]|uniref:Uncharacterized protein n=1 Tax=Corynespora cassiicola Philippines TaxID=1448308 RepID=A0A2T2NVI9_CORCC|nr:hypothetical protein BS50DRAFT_341584 [Corynespora cassiicola Philippines]